MSPLPLSLHGWIDGWMEVEVVTVAAAVAAVAAVATREVRGCKRSTPALLHSALQQ